MSAAGWCHFRLPAGVRARFSREPLVSSFLVTHAGCFPRCQRQKAWRPAPPAEGILILCLAGRGWVADLGRKRAPRLPVRAHEALLIAPGAPHFYAADPREPWTIVWFHFSGPRADAFVEQLGVRGLARGRVRNVALYTEPIRQILELRRQGHTRAVLVESNALGELVFARLYAESCLAPLPDARQSERRWPSPNHAEKLRDITAFLLANQARDLQVAEIARCCHVSESWLFHVFRAHTGFTPLGYLTHLRLQEASRLLLGTPLKMAAIAEAVGYEDPFYFSRLFKKHIGQSPDNYRREFRR